jgi:hypothetical protein
MAEGFEAEIRRAVADDTTEVVLVVRWAARDGQVVLINREPIDGTIRLSLGDPVLDRCWATDLHVATLARNMWGRVLGLDRARRVVDGGMATVRGVEMEFVHPAAPPARNAVGHAPHTRRTRTRSPIPATSR